jgi:hypothetical protein
MKLGKYDPHAVYVSPSPQSTFEHLNWYIYRATWVHLSSILHKSLPSVCVSMCIHLSLLGSGSVKIPLALLRNGSIKTLPRHKYTRNNRRIGRVDFYAVSVPSRKVRDLFFPEPVVFKHVIAYLTCLVKEQAAWAMKSDNNGFDTANPWFLADPHGRRKIAVLWCSFL